LTGSNRVIVIPKVRLAVPGDARGIAELSREHIEHGLSWRWTEARVLHSIASRSVNVAVIREHGSLSAFGIMDYGEETAHLALLGVHPQQRRRGLGRTLVLWLESCARTAGIGVIRLEVRADNEAGSAFYATLGFVTATRVPGYYAAQLDAIRLEKRLRVDAGDGKQRADK
jgi:ribosomal-protein-alanine N-acetyltransferase